MVPHIKSGFATCSYPAVLVVVQQLEHQWLQASLLHKSADKHFTNLGQDLRYKVIHTIKSTSGTVCLSKSESLYEILLA